MNQLEAVIKRAKRDIELKYVYTMMKPEELQTLLDYVDTLEKEVDKYHKLHDEGYNEMRIMKAELEKAKKPRPIEEWHEDYGDVLWWKFPIEEPPYCGTPLSSDWPEYHTHWTPIVIPTQIHEEEER